MHRLLHPLSLIPLFLSMASNVMAETIPVRINADICIYGGTSAGVISAVKATGTGRSVVLVESGQHLGGMSIEGLGGTDIDNHKGFRNSPAVGGLTLEFYRRISKHYGRLEKFDAMIHSETRDKTLWQFEPHVAENVFDEWVKEAGVQVLRGHRLAEDDGVKMDGTRILSIRFENGTEVTARMFIDATYEGDLLAFAGISFSVGREGNAKYGETKNGVRTDTTHAQFDRKVDPYRSPGDPSSGTIHGVSAGSIGEHGSADNSIQAYCFRMCLTTDETNRIPFKKPASYNPAHYEMHRRYLAAGGGIRWPEAHLPNGKTDYGGWHQLSGNLTGWNHAYPTASYAERETMLRTSREFIHGLYWFLANDPAVPPRIHDQWAAWGTCRDEFQDNEGWPRIFYVRNGRRMVSNFVLTENHLRKASPQTVDDPVGLIWWPPDLHHARRLAKDGAIWNEGAVFDGSDEADWIPCCIPYRAIIPRAEECTNLLSPTCPSSSYVAYGAYRIEFTFMVAAQSTATAAIIALENDIPVQKVPYPLLRERLLQGGQILVP